MEDKTRAAMEGYVEAYTKNEKHVFPSKHIDKNEK